MVGVHRPDGAAILRLLVTPQFQSGRAAGHSERSAAESRTPRRNRPIGHQDASTSLGMTS